MIVTPTTKKFGKYAPGVEFEFPDKTAKVFIKLGKLRAVEKGLTYNTRAMTAEAPAPAVFVAAPEPAAPPAGPLYVITVAGEPIPLDDKDRDELHALAKSLEVGVHHMAGAVKVREALMAAYGPASA